MPDRVFGPPMDPANPVLRVDLLLALRDCAFDLTDNSNVDLGVDWEGVFASFAQEQEIDHLPAGEYVFTVHHGLGFRVVELPGPTDEFTDLLRQQFIEGIQIICETTFRELCIGLVSFPTPRELRQAALSLVYASAQTAIRSLKDPTKFEPNFLTLIATGTNLHASTRKIERDGMTALLLQEGGFSLHGGIVVMPGIPDETGHVRVKVGYLPASPINDWLNAALVERLNNVVAEVREEVMQSVIAQFEDRRTWYDRAGARLRRLIGR